MGQIQKKISLQISLSIAALAVQLSAQATLSPQVQRGEQIIDISVPQRRSEICVIPRHLEVAEYSKKDLEKEKFLCSLNSSNSLVRPKLNSTNPGLDFLNSTGDDKVAKYKLSTSCSYAPSLLAYYHISRALGGVAQVPPAVLRTFTLDHHLKLGAIALSKTPASELIHKTWASLVAQLRAGARSPKKNLLFTDQFDQSYGALQHNPKQETFYRDFFSGGADNFSRAINFRNRNPVSALLKNPRPVSELIGRTLNAANLQKMIQMQDASEMILLDTMLSQQDRFGNIHYSEETYVRDASGALKKTSKKEMTPEELKSALTVKQMILKDNDCGVAKENISRRAGLPQLIKHLDPKTYHKLMQFERSLNEASTARFFETELLFTDSDFANLRRNTQELARELQQACRSGQLKLDLNLKNHFSNETLAQPNCEI